MKKIHLLCLLLFSLPCHLLFSVAQKKPTKISKNKKHRKKRVILFVPQPPVGVDEKKVNELIVSLESQKKNKQPLPPQEIINEAESIIKDLVKKNTPDKGRSIIIGGYAIKIDENLLYDEKDLLFIDKNMVFILNTLIYQALLKYYSDQIKLTPIDQEISKETIELNNYAFEEALNSKYYETLIHNQLFIFILIPSLLNSLLAESQELQSETFLRKFKTKIWSSLSSQFFHVIKDNLIIKLIVKNIRPQETNDMIVIQFAIGLIARYLKEDKNKEFFNLPLKYSLILAETITPPNKAALNSLSLPDKEEEALTKMAKELTLIQKEFKKYLDYLYQTLKITPVSFQKTTGGFMTKRMSKKIVRFLRYGTAGLIGAIGLVLGYQKIPKTDPSQGASFNLQRTPEADLTEPSFSEMNIFAYRKNPKFMRTDKYRNSLYKELSKIPKQK